MEINTVTRTVKVAIDNATLLHLFVGAVSGDAIKSTGKEQLLYRAFANLIGISDVDAVKIANDKYAGGENRITTDEFRRWLPTVFAEFAQVMLEDK